MSDVIKSIGTSGRDYATITSWEAALDNITYPDASTTAIGECYNDSVFNESVNIGTPGTNIVEIVLQAAEGRVIDLVDRHAAGVDHQPAQLVGIELLRYKTPGEIADDGGSGKWDIANIGAEPQRAKEIAFTAAYCEIESTYLVPAGSDITSVDQVDQPGRRIASAARAAYDLWLENNLQHAELVHGSGLDGSFGVFVEQKCDALAGLRPRLLTDAEQLPGSRVLDGRFTAVQQAMGTPRGRDDAGFEYLTTFVETAKAEGFVAELIAKHGVVGLSVAGPA